MSLDSREGNEQDPHPKQQTCAVGKSEYDRILIQQPARCQQPNAAEPKDHHRSRFRNSLNRLTIARLRKRKVENAASQGEMGVRVAAAPAKMRIVYRLDKTTTSTRTKRLNASE